jgi:hypothetical protein
LPVHNWFAESKAFFADFRHCCLRHHAEGIFLTEKLYMPAMNGDVIVAKRMKASQPDVPNAILSADVGLPMSALKSVQAFVSKSESPANLLLVVEHLLDVRFLIAGPRNCRATTTRCLM